MSGAALRGLWLELPNRGQVKKHPASQTSESHSVTALFTNLGRRIIVRRSHNELGPCAAQSPVSHGHVQPPVSRGCVQHSPPSSGAVCSPVLHLSLDPLVPSSAPLQAGLSYSLPPDKSGPSLGRPGVSNAITAKASLPTRGALHPGLLGSVRYLGSWVCFLSLAVSGHKLGSSHLCSSH